MLFKSGVPNLFRSTNRFMSENIFLFFLRCAGKKKKKDTTSTLFYACALASSVPLTTAVKGQHQWMDIFNTLLASLVAIYVFRLELRLHTKSLQRRELARTPRTWRDQVQKLDEPPRRYLNPTLNSFSLYYTRSRRIRSRWLSLLYWLCICM